MFGFAGVGSYAGLCHCVDCEVTRRKCVILCLLNLNMGVSFTKDFSLSLYCVSQYFTIVPYVIACVYYCKRVDSLETSSQSSDLVQTLGGQVLLTAGGVHGEYCIVTCRLAITTPA